MSNHQGSTASLNAANDSGHFTSILSADTTVELDKNLTCPKCNHIVIHPVEC